jgi:hypothetical protein
LALAIVSRWLRIPSYDTASGSLLYLASSDLLLVHSLADYVGSAEPHRNLLASSPCAVSGCVPFRHGHRLPRQLAQKSLFSLRHNWPTLFDRWRRFPTRRRAHDQRQHPFGLAIHPNRNRHSVFPGMAVCETFCVLALRMQIQTSDHRWNPPQTTCPVTRHIRTSARMLSVLTG